MTAISGDRLTVRRERTLAAPPAVVYRGVAGSRRSVSRGEQKRRSAPVVRWPFPRLVPNPHASSSRWT
jgi:hypothetical protein